MVTAIALIASPAVADHTEPREPLSPIDESPQEQGIANGEGTWEFIRNFPPNPGTDLEFFKKAGRTFVGSGTLGQGDEGHVGQRFIKLVGKSGKVNIKWIADHGSANCQTNNTGVTSLQHDTQVQPQRNPVLAIDTTDTTGRCHDGGGGGLEFIDISKLHKRKFKPREIHLTRHEGTSHTVTSDVNRPWILYNNTSDASTKPWIDVLNIKSCLNPKGTLKQKRARCRPKVYRIMFQPEWAQRYDANGDNIEGTEAACHDITSTKDGRLYCANLNSTIVLDVRGLTKPNGDVKGDPIKCEVIDGTNTGAKVTDCSQPQQGSIPQAQGWRYLGHVNHAGRNLNNLQTEYTVRESISVSHEAEPTPDKRFMFVTDERGGGIVPGGASCQNENENPYGNGGVHVFDISNFPNIEYAQTPEGENAIFIGDVVVPGATFCTAHVMEQIPGEQRFIIAWYSQGIKIVDYFIDAQGRWTFRETASMVMPGANTWAAEDFKITRNEDGTKTYHILASDISRGIDIMSWTGPTNPMGTPPPTPAELQRERSN
jgi:hypothetical protein